MPRTLARLPYGAKTNPLDEFDFEEDTEGADHSKYIWSNSAYAMGVNINRAFKLYGWCARIRGAESGGMVEGGMVLRHFEGSITPFADVLKEPLALLWFAGGYPAKEAVECVLAADWSPPAQLIVQEDIADMAIEDLRKWNCWDMADRVMALRTNKVYETKIVRRYILRFALDCKDSKACADYVDEMRKLDPEMVRDAEELLKLQQEK